MEAILNSLSRTSTPRPPRNLARRLKAALRRAFELAGAAYADGCTAPL